MTFPRLTLPVLGLMLVLVVAGCVTASTGPTEHRDDTFTVSGPVRLVVRSTNGSVKVEAGGSGDTVRVQATLWDSPRVRYMLEQEDNTISVTAEVPQPVVAMGRSPGADIALTVPIEVDLDIRTSNGAIEVTGARGDAEVRTSNGKLALTNFHGHVNGRTSNGPIELNDVEGTATLETSNGNVTLSGVKGTFDAEMSNGQIVFDGELVPGGSNRLYTSNGVVDVTFRGTPSVSVDITTSNGDIETQIPIEATTLRDDHVVGKIGGGEASLTIRTSNGDVRVR